MYITLENEGKTVFVKTCAYYDPIILNDICVLIHRKCLEDIYENMNTSYLWVVKLWQFRLFYFCLFVFPKLFYNEYIYYFQTRKNNLKKHSELKCIFIGERNGTGGMKKQVNNKVEEFDKFLRRKENRDEKE